MTKGSSFQRMFVLALAVVTMACSSLRPVATSSDEWLAYRKTRVSPTFEGRVIAAARYLARYPNGVFALETRKYYDTAEALYFDELRQEPDGLYTYLAALPRGPHADEARQQLYRRTEKARGPTGFDARIMAVDAQIGAIAARRTKARENILDALRMWLDADSYARPIAEARPTLVVPWSLSLPHARCTAIEDSQSGLVRSCVKLLEETYEVTNGNDLDERQATMEVAVFQDATGRPRKTILGGPDLFVRLEETFGGRTIAPDDTRGRAAGVSRATEVVRREFALIVSEDPTCRKRPKGSALLDLECHGVHVTVEAALDVASDDRIVIEPSAGP